GIVVDEGLVGRARVLGARFKEGLQKLAERHRSVAFVRGEGLMIGFDLVDAGDGSPWSAARCRRLFDALLARGVISMAYAPRVRINPPLVISEGEVDEALGLLGEALGEVAA